MSARNSCGCDRRLIPGRGTRNQGNKSRAEEKASAPPVSGKARRTQVIFLAVSRTGADTTITSTQDIALI